MGVRIRPWRFKYLGRWWRVLLQVLLQRMFKCTLQWQILGSNTAVLGKEQGVAV